MNKSNPFNPFLDKIKDMKGQRPPSMDELDPISCTKCENSIFDRYFKMYRLSSLKTASGKEQLFNVPIYVCASCAEILDTSNIDNTIKESSTKIEEEVKK